MKYSKNKKVLEILFDLSIFNNNKYKRNAFRNAYLELKKYNKIPKNLKEIPFIGDGISKRINIILNTGTLPEWEKIRKNKNFLFMKKLIYLPGFTIENTRNLVKKLNLNSVEKLKSYDKITKSQLLSLNNINDISRKIPYSHISGFKKYFSVRLKLVNSNFYCTIAGSYRRKNKNSKDIDLLIYYKGKKTNLMDISLKILEKRLVGIYHKGDLKFSGLFNWLDSVRRIDIRIFKYSEYPTALQYFTGSKEFNIWLRKKAQEQGYKLNEYGLYRGGIKLNIKKEREIFQKLKTPYYKPADRIQEKIKC